MSLVSKVLSHPFIWRISQNVLSSDRGKRAVYRSVVRPPGKRILDFGCANGNTFPAFNDLEYCGVDLSETFIRDAQQKYAAWPNARFVHADILAGPFEPGSFDHILFACTGHHLDDGTLTKILVALSQLLAAGGAIHFFDPVRRPGRDSLLLRLIMHYDQGKHHRTEEQYRQIFSTLSEHLQLHRTDTFRFRDRSLTPQPTVFYAELRSAAQA